MMDLNYLHLYDMLMPYFVQFSETISSGSDGKAELPSGAYIEYIEILKQIDHEDESLIESYDDERDKFVIKSLISFFKKYENLRIETINRVVKILESCGFDDMVMLTYKDNPRYPSALAFITGEVDIATRRLTDGVLKGDYPYIWGSLKCDSDYDEFVRYPFAIRFSFEYCGSSDEGYDISDDKMKQCPDFETISIVDSEFETKLRDRFKNIHDFVMNDIDSFFKKDAEFHEELKQRIIDYVNAPDTTFEALIYLTEKLEDYISRKED